MLTVTPLRLGSLFSGYGGLDLAVEAVTGARTVWVSDVEPGPCQILAERFPGVPNVGDITAVDWSRVEPVDVLAGGSPCPDLSVAGARAGMRPSTRSGLWASMLDAVAALRPSLVIWENVYGALSAPASSASDLEPTPGGVGDGPRRPALRALGRVLGDLANRGYDAAWHCVRAADVGAPHGRARVFVLAWPAETTGDAWRVGDRDRGTAAHADDDRRPPLVPSGHGSALTWPTGDPSPALLRTPTAQLATNGGSQDPAKRRAGGHGPTLADEVEHLLLPTPTTEPTTGNGHARNLGHEVGSLLPTPRASDGTKGGPNQRGSSGDLMLPSAVMLLPTPRASAPDAPTSRSARARYSSGDSLGDLVATQTWGVYASAITRWETALGWPAPPPTEPTGRAGAHRLSPAFVEWMMGLPPGWVTGVPGITRAQMLRALGNGVVPRQAAHTLRYLLNIRAHYGLAA